MMSLPPFLEFIHRGLSVRYTAAAEPQEVHVDLLLAERDPKAAAPGRMRMLIDAINAGAAGGAEFAPWAGAARLVAGPASSLDPGTWDYGPAYRWVLEIAGVSALFWRLAVPVLALAGAPIPARKVGIVGAQRADNYRASVSEAHVAAWLRDVVTYPGRWPALPFELREDVIPGGCALRVRFDGEASPDVVERLDEVVGLWGVLTVGCPSLARDGLGARSFLDRLGVARAEYSRFIEEFNYAQEIAGSILVNMLARFHHDVAPIAWVDLRMP